MSLDVAATPSSNAQNYIDGVSVGNGVSYSTSHAQHTAISYPQQLQASAPVDIASPGRPSDQKAYPAEEAATTTAASAAKMPVKEDPEVMTSPTAMNPNINVMYDSCLPGKPSDSSPQPPTTQNVLPHFSEYAMNAASKQQPLSEGVGPSPEVASLREALSQPQMYGQQALTSPSGKHGHHHDLMSDLRAGSGVRPSASVASEISKRHLSTEGATNNSGKAQDTTAEVSTPLKNNYNMEQMFHHHSSPNMVRRQVDEDGEALHSSKSAEDQDYQHYLAASRQRSDSGSFDEDSSHSMMSAYHSEARESFLNMSGVINKQDLFYCHLCNYVGNSKFLFNEHMNSHFEHQCPHCDYTSRTEGRLKRHIKDFHSQTPPENYSGNRVMKPVEESPQQGPPRQKVYRCKQCEYVAIHKSDFWEHARSHIKADKILQCPKCPFVTEYKHHLEYHLRNHFGSKPFKCNKCNYSCVNKSMLNSHMKSHTNVYQYRCADCTYATKYCHSLKLHLRKYNHKPATVLNSDGSLPIDGSGDFELVSKRGPPRGPRGPRKERDMHDVHMSPIAGGLNPNMLLHQAAAANGLHSHGFNAASLAAASAFWPLLGQFPNGLQPPPPLVPVSGLGMFPGPGLHPPTTPTQEARASPHRDSHRPSPQSQPHPQLQQQHQQQHQQHQAQQQPSPYNKCSLCEYSADSMTELNQHMLKVHAAENNDLFSMFGISPEALQEHASKSRSAALANHFAHMLPVTPKSKHMLSLAQIKSEPGVEITKSPCSPKIPSTQSTPRSWPTPASHSPPSEIKSAYTPTTPYLDKESPLGMNMRANGPGAAPLSSTKKAIAEDLAASIEAEVRQNGEIPLDLTKPKGCNGENEFGLQNFMCTENSAKRKLDYGPPSPSSQDQVASTSPLPLRKRSRKGPAFKLDTICMKLQERCTTSPTQGSGYESNEDYMSDYASSEKGEDANGAPARASSGNPAEESGEPAAKDAGRDVSSNAHDEDNQSNIDYMEIHDNLRQLNQDSQQAAEQEFPYEVAPQEEASQKQDTGKDEKRKGDDATPNKSEGQTTEQTATPSINRRKLFVVRRTEVNQEKTSSSEEQVGDHTSDHNSMDDYSDDEAERMSEADYTHKGQHDLDEVSQPSYECKYCQISFRDCVMYTMHIGYHGYQDPFKCNMCGHQSSNRVEFFLHIAREAHSSHGHAV